MASAKKRSLLYLAFVFAALFMFVFYSSAHADDGFDIQNKVLVKYTGEEKNVVIPDGVKSIGDGAFLANDTIETVVIPDGVKKIGEMAFHDCANLKSVTMTDSVTEIKRHAFSEDPSLTSIRLSESITRLNESMFFNDKSLERIVLPDNITEIDYSCFNSCEKLVFVGMPSKLEKLYPYNFNGCKLLTSISFPKTIQIISNNNFYNCTSLKTVFYEGTKAQWQEVVVRTGEHFHEGIYDGNDALLNATFVYGKMTTYFNDVMRGSWYTEHVQYLFNRGAMTGLNASDFGTGMVVDRSTCIMILYKMEGQPDVMLKAPFLDVTTSRWFSKAVIWAKQEGITTGYTKGDRAGCFGPEDELTRQDFMTLLYRYAEKKGYDLTVPSADVYFEKKDADKVASYARTAVNWGYYNGFIGSGSDLLPADSITREQAATIISRFLRKYDA